MDRNPGEPDHGILFQRRSFDRRCLVFRRCLGDFEGVSGMSLSVRSFEFRNVSWGKARKRYFSTVLEEPGLKLLICERCSRAGRSVACLPARERQLASLSELPKARTCSLILVRATFSIPRRPSRILPAGRSKPGRRSRSVRACKNG